jgi:hypothetical protein
MLDETIVTESRRSFSRQSILLRLLSHDAYHAGELSQTLGIVGLPQIDPWPPEDQPPPRDRLSPQRPRSGVVAEVLGVVREREQRNTTYPSSSRRRIKLAVSATFPASLMAWSYAARDSCLRPIRRRRSARVAW